MAASRENGIADEVVDQLLAGRDPATVFESGGLVDELKKRLAERMLNGEMDHHLGGEAEEQAGNHRNGYSSKTVLTDSGRLELAIPRDRQGRFDPVLIGKYRRRFPGFDDKIIALYARGMTTREIAEHIGELYGAEIVLCDCRTRSSIAKFPRERNARRMISSVRVKFRSPPAFLIKAAKAWSLRSRMTAEKESLTDSNIGKSNPLRIKL